MVLEGTCFHEFSMFQVCFLKFVACFCGSGPSRVPEGRQGAHPDAKCHEKDPPRLRNGLPFGMLFEAGSIFSAFVFMWFSQPLFIARFAVWCDFGRCFGRHFGSLGPLKIMPKCTTVCIFRVWGVFVRSLFPELLLEGVWQAFYALVVPIGAPVGLHLATVASFFRA